MEEKATIELIREKEELTRRLQEIEEKLKNREDPLISSLDISVRAFNALNRYGFKRVSELFEHINTKDPKFEMIRNVGKTTRDEIFEVLGLEMKK